MMSKSPYKNQSVRLYWSALVTALALIVAACGTGGPATSGSAGGSSVGAVQATATEAPATVAATGTVTTTDTSQNVVKNVVEQSQAAKAAEQKGVTVTSKEDVTTPRDSSKFGGEYHSVATSDAVSFHPYLTTDTTSGSYQGMVYASGLLRLDENTLQYIPNMAESYSISPDGLTFTFKIRHGMKWSDDQPITAQDWQWTYDQVKDPKHEFPYLSQLDFIDSYKAVDDYTLQVKIKEVYAPALGQIDLITPLPKHIWEKLDWSDPTKNPEINHPTVVSGPYKLQEWKRDQYATFVANDNYWYHGRPNIDRQVIEIVPDQDIAYQKMKTGESDTATIPPEKLDEARKLSNINVYEWWPAAATWSYIGLNMRDGFVTHDINVRHGINYAINKQEITDQVMLGQAKRLCSLYPETSWVYNPDVPCYNFDTQKALDAFKQAGYTFDGQKMVDKDGKQLELKLVYGPNTSKVRELIAVAVQSYLQKIGIKVDIQSLEWASFLDAIQSKSRIGICSSAAGGRPLSRTSCTRSGPRAVSRI